MPLDMHPFFNEIKKYPELIKYCNMDITDLPSAYKGKDSLKAVLLGADPSNNGIRNDEGLKILKTVFGINSIYESAFFNLQRVNLEALGLTKDNCYVQNICRNYFAYQTSGNKKFNEIAKIWLTYLKEELDFLDSNLPVLVTAERIMKVLVPNLPSAIEIYNLKHKLPFYSESLKRNVIPLYRNPNYLISSNWNEYREQIKLILNV